MAKDLNHQKAYRATGRYKAMASAEREFAMQQLQSLSERHGAEPHRVAAIQAKGIVEPLG